jgi:hypothetical protein
VNNATNATAISQSNIPLDLTIAWVDTGTASDTWSYNQLARQWQTTLPLMNSTVRVGITDEAIIRNRPPLEFNKYLNASDLLEEFIRFVREQGAVEKDGILQLPVELFVRWLIVRAMEEDKEAPPEPISAIAASLVPHPVGRTVRHRCLGCGRFMRHAPLALHGSRCADRFYARQPQEMLA